MLRLCGLAGKLWLGLEPEICAAKAGRFERGSVWSPGALKFLSSVSFQFSVFSFQFSVFSFQFSVWWAFAALRDGLCC